jgi:3-oxoacyl-[acyl-carrier protein] reductase
MKVDLKDKVAVVTGSAGGIGKCIVQVYLENGAKVVVADVKDDEGQKTVTELSRLGECKYVHCDVSDRRSVEALVAETLKRFGRIDILVNNAGVNIHPKRRTTIDEFPEDEWHKILAVDLTGVFHCSQLVSREMIKRKSGRIINIGSVFGGVPARQQIAYVAAKAGVHNMTGGMAMELAPHGITVNAVAPGSTLTEGTRTLFYGDDAAQKAFRERMLSHVPLGKPGDGSDIANAVLFLSGEESRYITGHVLTVDGGWTCGYTRDF